MPDLPKPADPALLRQVTSESQAVAVSMHGMKLAVVAVQLGKSEAYLSRIRSGKRPVPAGIVDAFCRVTGTLLLKQVIKRAALEKELEEGSTDAMRNARLAQMLRSA